jgi:uncharacterized protein YgfB (UPF0149 family)
MAEAPILPNYDDVDSLLKQANARLDAAGAHGLLCAFICAKPGQSTTKEWETLILGDLTEAKKNAGVLLEELYELSYHLLSEFSFEFMLLLPDDSVDINQRAELLGLWCQGFLVGLEKCGISLHNHPQNDVTDALNDIIEIAQVSFGDITDSEEDETAYLELLEHVRLSALMIFCELNDKGSNKLAIDSLD